MLRLFPACPNYWVHSKFMETEFDPDNRRKTLKERGLDFARATKIFEGHHFTTPDLRENYGEDRYITAGKLDGCM